MVYDAAKTCNFLYDNIYTKTLNEKSVYLPMLTFTYAKTEIIFF